MLLFEDIDRKSICLCDLERQYCAKRFLMVKASMLPPYQRWFVSIELVLGCGTLTFSSMSLVIFRKF